MDENFKNPNMISSVEAAELFGITNDYVTMLCRQKKIGGVLMSNRLWFVDKTDLEKFFEHKKQKQEVRNQELSQQFKRVHAMPLPVVSAEVEEQPIQQWSFSAGTMVLPVGSLMVALALVASGSMIPQVKNALLAAVGALPMLEDQKVAATTPSAYGYFPQSTQSVNSQTNGMQLISRGDVGRVEFEDRLLSLTQFVIDYQDTHRPVFLGRRSSGGTVVNNVTNIIGGSGSSNFGQTFELASGALIPTTTLGIIVASSTIAGDLTVTGTMRLSSLTNCDTIDSDSNGNLSCGTDQTATGAANAFTFATNYGVMTAATSSVLWAQAGIFASSTSHFATADFANGFMSFASSTIGNGTAAGGLTVNGTATTTTLVVTGLNTNHCLQGSATVPGLIVQSSNACGSGTVNTGTTGQLAYFSANGQTVSGTSTLFVDTTSRVGIGTTSPFANLSIHANNGETNKILFAIGSSTASATSTLFSVSNTGSVIMGTSTFSTTTQLVIKSSGLPSATTDWIMAAYDGTGALRTHLNTFGAQTWYLQSGGSERGSIAYGTPSSFPGIIITEAFGVGRFDIVNQTASLFRMGFNADGADALTFGASDKIGIGSTTPFGLLSVNPDGITGPAFVVGSSTQTLFSISNMGSTTLGRFGACNTTSALTTDSSGNIICGAITGSGSSGADFTYGQTNFGQTVSATSTALWLQSGLMASSTSRIASTTFDIIGRVGIGSSTPYRTLSVNGTVEFVATTTAGSYNWANAMNSLMTEPLVRIGLNANGQGLLIKGPTGITASTYLGISDSFGTNLLSVSGTSINTEKPFIGPSSVIGSSLNTSGTTDINIFGSDVLANPAAAFVDGRSGPAPERSTPLVRFSFDNGPTLSKSAGGINALFGTTTGSRGLAFYSYSTTTGTFVENIRIQGNGNTGISSSSPFATLSVHAQNGASSTVLFAIGSSTATATSTLFAITNTGSTTIAGGLTVLNNATTTGTLTLGAGGGSVDGARLLVLNIERSWAFEQSGSGAGASLSLRSDVDSKSFLISSSDKSNNPLVVAVANTGANSLVELVPTAGRATVGLGVTAPGLLSVGNISGSESLHIRADNDSASSYVINVVDENDLSSQFYIKSRSGNGSNVYDTYFGAGNVGIGTTSPLAKLTVASANASSQFPLFLVASSSAGLATTTYFSISSTGSTTLGNFGACNTTSALTTDSSGNIICGAITGSGSSGADFLYGVTAFGTTTSATTTPIWARGGVLASTTSVLVNTTFASNGNVGIATSSPFASLSITGNNGWFAIDTSTFGTTKLMTNDSNGTLRFIGGQGSIHASLQTAGDIFVVDKPLNNLYTNLTIHRFNTEALGTTLGNAIFVDDENSVGRFVVKGNGNVGLGTSSPWGKFTISINNGEVLPGNHAFLISSSTSNSTTTLFAVSNSGSTTISNTLTVGNSISIGTSSQNEKLYVQGGVVSNMSTSTFAISNYMGGFGASFISKVDANISYNQAYLSYGDTSIAGWNEYLRTRSVDGSGFKTLQNGDEVARFNFRSDNGSSYMESARIVVGVDGTPTTGVTAPGMIAFWTSRAGLSSAEERMRITNLGLVGIGTTSPTALLTVGSTNATTTRPLFMIASSSPGVATSSVFIVDGAGNIGIGTSTPYARLSVVGEVVANNFTATSTTATSTFAGGLNVGSGSLTYDFASGLTTIQNLAIGSQFFDTDAGIIAWVDMPVTSASATGTVQSYTAYIDGQPVLTAYAVSDGMGGVWQPSVGIGSTTPWATFAVEQQATSSPVLVVGDSGTSTPHFMVSGKGYVGIGTTTPLGLLSINPNGIAGPAFVIGSSTQTLFSVSNTGNTTVSGTVVASDGSVSAPGFAFSGNTNTGIANVGGALLFVRQGSQVASVDSSNISNNIATGGFNWNITGVSMGFYRQAQGTVQLTSGGLNSGSLATLVAGSIGLGTSTPYAQLSILATSTNGLGSPTTLFAIASTSQGNSTSTLFSVDNMGGFKVGTSSADGNTMNGFIVRNNAATAGNGLVLLTSGTGGGVQLFASSSATNEQLMISSKGNSNTVINAPSGSVILANNGNSRLTVGNGNFTYASGGGVGGSTPVWNAGAGQQGSLTASTEVPNFSFNMTGGISTHLNGALALQREYRITAPVHAFSTFNSGANIINQLALFGVEGPVPLGTNAKATNSYGILVGSSTPSIMFNASTTNSYGLGVFAAGGATNNYAATFMFGNSGFGSTSPFASLSIHANSNDAITNTTLFAVGSSTASATTTLFSVSNAGHIFANGLSSSATGNALCITAGGEVTDAGGGTCTPSSLRFKEHVESLNSGNGLEILNKLRVVSFDYKKEFASPEESPASLGFIAEEIEQIDPRLVDYGYDGKPLTVHFERITGLTVQAIQELNLNLQTLASTTASSTPQSQSFAQSFFNNLFARVTQWLASAANGIGDLFAGRVHTKEICVGETGNETCITKDKLDALLANTASASSNNNPEPTGEAPQIEPPVEPEASSTPPIVEPTPEPTPEPEPPAPEPVPEEVTVQLEAQ